MGFALGNQDVIYSLGLNKLCDNCYLYDEATLSKLVWLLNEAIRCIRLVVAHHFKNIYFTGIDIMSTKNYKKMAGTSAVFISTDYSHASPVERDGMVWNEDELHLKDIPEQRNQKPSMSTVLALEGLEDYDKPSDGDVRQVESMGVDFVYIERVHAWVQTTEL
jgi:hypothetical protein